MIWEYPKRFRIVDIGFPNEYAASASAGTVVGPLGSEVDEYVEFGLPMDDVVEVDGVGSCDDLSSIIGESLS